MAESVKKVRERFIEQIGLVAQGDGLPRIAGRLMGLMVFDGEPRSFSDLATELKVSRGSISNNARLLESLGVIERVTRPGDRQDYFQLADEPYDAIIEGALARSVKARDTVGKTLQALPAKGQNGPRQRLKEYERFYARIVEALDDVARR